MRNLRFIDLFAGLGGFHQALASRGAKCVFASELKLQLADLYEKNFGIRPVGDIRKVDLNTIADHDILCAGFPCQPFSKAGDQKGLECPRKRVEAYPLHSEYATLAEYMPPLGR